MEPPPHHRAHEPRRKPGLAVLVVGLGLLAFAAYLIWYGFRISVDTEPLYIAVGVLPLSAGVLGYYFWRAVHKLVGVAVALSLVLGAVGYSAWGYQRAVRRRDNDRAEAANRRLAIALCESGTPFPQAPAYTGPGQATVSIFSSFYGEDRPLRWGTWPTEFYAVGWQAQGLPQLVACLRSRYTTLDSRTYTGGPQGFALVRRRQHSFDVTLHEARTGAVVFQTTLTGAEPRPHSESVTIVDGRMPRDIDGSQVGHVTVLETLAPYVRPLR